MIMDWREVYKLPLHLDSYSMYAYTSNDVMAISGFNCIDDGFPKKIIDIINGDIESYFFPEWTVKDKCDIYYEDNFIFCVRGWGYLCGCGALNLPIKVAAKIQDDFINYILNRLNG